MIVQLIFTVENGKIVKRWRCGMVEVWQSNSAIDETSIFGNLQPSHFISELSIVMASVLLKFLEFDPVFVLIHTNS